MVAASRSGSTWAVMRLSSPSASTFSSQRSRSLALAARGGLADGLAASPSLCGLIVTLSSMVFAPAALLTRIVTAREQRAMRRTSRNQQHRARDAARFDGAMGGGRVGERKACANLDFERATLHEIEQLGGGRPHGGDVGG